MQSETSNISRFFLGRSFTSSPGGGRLRPVAAGGGRERHVGPGPLGGDDARRGLRVGLQHQRRDFAASHGGEHRRWAAKFDEIHGLKKGGIVSFKGRG